MLWAHARGARAVFAMGNHDQRDAFRAVLGGGQPDADELQLDGIDLDRPVVSVVDQGDWRVVVLDSSVPGAGYGAIGPEQLAFLRLLSLHRPAKAQSWWSTTRPYARRPICCRRSRSMSRTDER